LSVERRTVARTKCRLHNRDLLRTAVPKSVLKSVVGIGLVPELKPEFAFELLGIGVDREVGVARPAACWLNIRDSTARGSRTKVVFPAEIQEGSVAMTKW
jgi:hypothetical protein